LRLWADDRPAAVRAGHAASSARVRASAAPGATLHQASPRGPQGPPPSLSAPRHRPPPDHRSHGRRASHPAHPRQGPPAQRSV